MVVTSRSVVLRKGVVSRRVSGEVAKVEWEGGGEWGVSVEGMGESWLKIVAAQRPPFITVRLPVSHVSNDWASQPYV